MNKNAADILISPRITEKGAYLAEQGAYVFNVAPAANKKEIAAAVAEIFKVVPRMVRIVTVPRKRTMTRGSNKVGFAAGGKKAYVYLKEGETIDLV